MNNALSLMVIIWVAFHFYQLLAFLDRVIQ